MSKPTTAAGYTPAHLQEVRATCLQLASILGDLLDELVVVGGLVPSLLIDAARSGAEPHVGTMDLDLGLELALLRSERYHALAERLRGSGFEPDRNEQGNLTRQRWGGPGRAPRSTFSSRRSRSASAAELSRTSNRTSPPS